MRWGLALLLAGIAAWLSVRQIHWPELCAVLAQANLLLLGAALATVLVTTTAKAAPAILGPIGTAIEGLSWNRLGKAQGGSLGDDGVAA